LSKKPYYIGSNGQCPHCQRDVTFDSASAVRLETGGRSSLSLVTSSGGDSVYIYSSKCPNNNCKKPIVTATIGSDGKVSVRLVHPFNIVRTVPSEVPKHIADDFNEAAAVLSVSEKASAALSRRCLQNLLTDKGHKQKDLHKQIGAAIKVLPTEIAENLDAIRNIGNFAAHPMKHKISGLIVDVEPEEAEWNLEVLESLFDYYYVQPKKAEAKRKKLNAKLKGVGKPPMKKP